ncbi:MAG TPA: TolC family protein [Polyangiaceae bacterium]
MPPRFASAAALAFVVLTTPFLGRAQAQPPAPEVPAVNDPMLAPPPEPPRRIASWDEALTLIRTQSTDYLSSAQAIDRARAQKRIALAAVLPMLVGQVSYVHEFNTESFTLATVAPGMTAALPVALVSPPPDLFTFAATATWSILNPRALYEVGTADRNIEVARLSFEDRRRLLATDVVASMLATLAAARVSELDRVGLRAALERLTLAKTRLELGQGTELDVDRAQADVEAARALIVQADETLRRTREALGVALGSPVALAAPGDLDLEQFEAAVAKTCRPNDDIEQRPDVRAAQKRVEVAVRGVRDAELLLAPWLTVSSQASYSTEAVLGPNTIWSAQAAVTVPFYDGGARYGALRDARAALEQARQALVSARLEAIVGSTQAQRDVGVFQEQRDVARRQRDLADRIDRRTRDGYVRGIGTSLDLVTSAQALRQAEISLALFDFQVGQARANAVLTNAECVY